MTLTSAKPESHQPTPVMEGFHQDSRTYGQCGDCELTFWEDELESDGHLHFPRRLCKDCLGRDRY